MRTLSLLLLVAAVAPPLAAQRPALDLSGGLTSQAWRASVAAPWHTRLGPLTLGAGPRLTRYGGDPARYRTHDTPPAGAATRLLVRPDLWSLNLFVLGEVTLAGPVGVGANLDLAGVAEGPSRRVSGATLSAARWSLFRYGDNDRGSLTSEVYLRLEPGARMGIRAGLSHSVTGYRATQGGARYLRFDTVPFLALRWRP